MKKVTLNLCSKSEVVTVNCVIEKAVIAGWTGRDREALEAHIVELEELGVKRPDSVPCYYPVTSATLTTDEVIEVIGKESSGEVEFVILKSQGELWIGVGSDHTDRDLETHDVTFSKQVCAKPIADTFWLLSEVLEHWEQLSLQSYIEEDGERRLYQEGPVTAMLDPRDLMSRYEEVTGSEFEDNMVMFGGTLAAIGGIRASGKFEFQLKDPVFDRSIKQEYQIIER